MTKFITVLNLLTLIIGYLAVNHVGKKYLNKIIIVMEAQESHEVKNIFKNYIYFYHIWNFKKHRVLRIELK